MPKLTSSMMLFSSGVLFYLIFQDISPMSKLQKSWIQALFKTVIFHFISKIICAFIRKIHENNLDQAIVQSMINVSKGFEIFTIAEFVENEVILKMLNNMSVDYAQGYYVGPPEPEPIFKINF